MFSIVVNAALKAGIRRIRFESLFDCFQLWKMRRLQELVKPVELHKLPEWGPPKPTVHEGVRTAIQVEATTLTTSKFK